MEGALRGLYRICVMTGHAVFWYLFWKRFPDRVSALAKATLGGAVLGLLLGMLIGGFATVQVPETPPRISSGAALGGLAGLFLGALSGFAMAKRDAVDRRSRGEPASN
jgi:membrane associated rhomboid family serine protease